MSQTADEVRADVVQAEATISECLAATTAEDREERLAAAYNGASGPVRLAFTFCLMARVAERGKR